MRVSTVIILLSLCFGMLSCGGSGDQQQIHNESDLLNDGMDPLDQNSPNIPPHPIGNDSLSGLLDDDKELNWTFQQNISFAEFSEQIQLHRSKGHMLIDIDTHSNGSNTKFSMIWRENLHDRAWVEAHGISYDMFLQTSETHSNNGFRPADIEVYTDNGRQTWAGVWVKNDENLQWSMHHSVSSLDIGTHLLQNREAGFRLVDIDIHPASIPITYTTIWYQNSTDLIWDYESGMTYNQYTQQVESKQAIGLKVVDVESYSADQEQLYAAIWQELTDFTWQVAADRTEQQFKHLYNRYNDEGYRLIDVERHGSETDPRFSGIWAENSPRLRDSQSSEIDSLVSDYAQANHLPGISVAVIKRGGMIYRKGFGLANKEQGKLAHGETVYNIASIAKAIGGTLAAKLESEGRLRDGTTFNLDLSQLTPLYLQNLPSANGSGTISVPDHHTHSVQQLLAHLGCVPHYNTQPNILNSTFHFPSSSDAVQSIWDKPLVSQTTNGEPCTPGSTYSYSTGAYTFVGAALETTTGRTVNQLIEEELAIPYGLSSIRAQYASSTLTSNDERARPYNSANEPIGYDDNSWKVLGGGIEASAVDLARFGWYVFDGQIVNASTRDNRLWSRVNFQESNYGLGWEVFSSRAEMSGSWAGARGILRVYRNDGLVIAVLSNRRDHRVDDVRCLAEKIRNSIINMPEVC